jgi:hypothetical protein
MALEDDIEASLDVAVAVEGTAGAPGQRDGSATFTIRCDPDDEERLREQLAAVEAAIAFEPNR